MPTLPDGTKCGLDDAFAAGLTRTDLAGQIVDSLPANGGGGILQTRRGSEIESREVTWLWRPWLPAGMLALFAGYGGGGKSTTALHIAAAGSVGGTFPDGQPAPPFNTLIFAAEDSPEHTIRPRLDSLGANLDRVHVVDGVPRPGGDPGWVQLRNHAPDIERTITELDIGLVIVDPVSSFIGDANSDRESDVRAGIVPLVKVAERTGAAMLLIRHVSKSGDGVRAASRILGSTAWHDIPRAVWMLADAPEEHQPESGENGLRDTRRVLGVVKSNLAAKPQARWCLQPVDGPLRWLQEAAPVTIDECFFAPSDRGSKVRDAEEWLRERLAGGSQPTTTVEAAAKDAGISGASLRRARASLNVSRRKESTGQWILSLPPRLVPAKTEPEHSSSNSGHETPVSALHNAGEPKAFAVNALNALPELQGNPDPFESAIPSPRDPEQGKAFKGSYMRPLNAFHNEVLRPTGTDGALPGEIPL